MNKTKPTALEVISPGEVSLKERRDRVVNYHTGCKGAAKQQVIYALMAGMELTQAKAAVPHGQWMNWVAEFPEDLPHRTATLYMRFAEALQPKLATVANFNFEQLRLVNGDLPKDQKEIVLEAVKETTSGSSLTDLYRELGIVKHPTARESAPAKKEMSPSEAQAAIKQAAEDRIKSIITDLELITDEERALISNALRDQFYDALLTETSALRELKTTKGKKK